MSLFTTVFASVLLGAPAPAPMGSIYGKVLAKASHYVTHSAPENGFARRHASPAAPLKEPLGVVVSLEGAALEKEKFDPPVEEVKIEWKAMGLEPRLIGCMVGSPLSIHNTADTALELSGIKALKEAIPGKGTSKITLDEVGVFEVSDRKRPGATITLVVAQNPFVIALDETGEFLFEDLVPGPYTLKVFARSGARQVPVVVKPSEREQVTIALQAAKKEAK
jgi:hypothetical protein